MNWQIQGIPTPNIYEARSVDPVRRDAAAAVYALTGVEVIPPMSRVLTPETATAPYALVSCQLPGPVNRNVTDAATPSYALVSCLVPVPLTRSVNETADAGYALVSVLQLTPTTRTITTETVVTAGYALVSCTLP